MSELHEAAFSGDLASLRNCLRTGCNANEPDPEWGGRTPLHIASCQGHADCVTLLLDAGAKMDAVTDAGWTPAHYACEAGQVEKQFDSFDGVDLLAYLLLVHFPLGWGKKMSMSGTWCL